MTLKLCVGLLSGLLASAPTSAESKPVKTSSGQVSGTLSADKKVSSYKGLPYAAPPTGDLRWRPPQSATPWIGVRKSDQYGANCMQAPNTESLPWTKEFLYRGPVSEDCLYLNIWKPTASVRAGYPVLVFIHGGGFQAGSGNVEIYDGESLARMGLVVVTINYRLGVFGFLAHPELTAESEHHSSGNYGLLDQIAALRWVNENIREFGGDPARVTISGQSAGAFSVRSLIASPLAKGLFRAAIAESGIGITGLPRKDLKTAEHAGIALQESRKLASVRELRAIPAAELFAGLPSGMREFSPIIDGWVLPATPQELSSQGKDSDVPILTGWQANDARSLTRPASSAAEYEQRARTIYGSMSEEFLNLYPAGDGNRVQASEADSARERERVSMFLWASDRLRNHRSRIYTYSFDRAIPWPQHPEYGAFHTGEVPYVFKTLKSLDRPFEPIDFEISDTVSSLWKNFVSTEDPNGSGLPKWSPVDPALPFTMRIGVKSELLPLAEQTRLDFWLRYFHSEESRNAPLF